MFDKRHEKLLEDAFSFMKLIGGAMELSDRGWDNDIAMPDYYLEEVEKYFFKHLPDKAECITDIEECLMAERLLEDYFKEEILEIMNR